MPIYTKKDLITMEHPYQLLIEQDALPENQGALEKLSYPEKVDLVTKLILGCPSKDISKLYDKTKTLKFLPEDSFFYKLNQGLQVYSLIQEMLDPARVDAYQIIFEPDLYPSLFEEFHELSRELVNGNSIPLSIALLDKTPVSRLDGLMKNMHFVFSHTKFIEDINNICILKNLISLLKSDEPYQAFLSEDYNPSLFHEYKEVVRSELTDLNQVALKLSDCSPTCRNDISKKLKNLSSSYLHDAEDPFNKINGMFLEHLSVNEEVSKKQVPYFFKPPHSSPASHTDNVASSSFKF